MRKSQSKWNFSAASHFSICSRPGRVEFHEHFSFLHVDQHAARGDFLGGVHAARQFFGALAREAGQRVLREVTRHSGSCSAKMSGH